MAFDRKKFLKSTGIYGLLGFLPAAPKFILFPLFVKILSPYDYGLIGMTASLVTVLSIFVAMGLDNGFGRFFFDYRRSKKLLHGYFSTILLTIKAVGVVIIGISLLLGEYIFPLLFKDPDYTFFPFGVYALVLAFFIANNGIILAFHRSNERPLAFMTLVVGNFTCITILESIAVLVFRTDGSGVLLARCIGLCTFSIPYWIWLYSRIGIRFDIRYLKQSFAFGLPLIPFALLGFVYFNADRFLIENLLDMSQVGIFNTAFTIAFLLETILIAVQNATTPTIYGAMKTNYKESFHEVNLIFRLTGWIIVFLAAAIFLVVTPFVLEFTRPAYHPALLIVPLLCGGFLFKYLYTVYITPVFFFKKTKRIVWLNVIAAVVIVVGNLLLLPVIGLLGAAISMFLSRLAQVIATRYLAGLETDFKYQLKSLGPVLIGMMLMTIAITILHYTELVNPYILFSTPAVLLGLVLIVFLLRNRDKIRTDGIQSLKQYV